MKQIIMYICPNCEEPNSCNGSKCPYCTHKGSFKQVIFIVKDRWIKTKVKLIDRALKRIRKDRWLDRIPDIYWYNLCDIEKNFLFKIQEEIDKTPKPKTK